MNLDPETHSHTNRPSRWPYWFFVPICSLSYSGYCTWFLFEAWGRNGTPKPAWFDVAYFFAVPGMYIIPIPVIGSLLVGGFAGFFLVSFVQKIIAKKSRGGDCVQERDTDDSHVVPIPDGSIPE